MKINPRALAAQVTKERSWLMRFRCFEERNCSDPSMFLFPQSLPPTFPSVSTGMFPWKSRGESGTKRKLFSPRGHGFSESLQRGLSRRYERGASLSTSTAWSLVSGSCECLLNAYCALGASELFRSVTNTSFFEQVGCLCQSSSVAALVTETLWNPSASESTHPTTWACRIP